MKRIVSGTGVIITAIMSLVMLVNGSCAPAVSFDNQLKSIITPYTFSIVGWEFEAIPREITRRVFDGSDGVAGDVELVTEYFRLVERINSVESELEAIKSGNNVGDVALREDELSGLQQTRADLDEVVEGIVSMQIKETLAEQGIFNPIIGLRVSFPPILFKLQKPPHLLVVSPRDRIESIREVTLQPHIGLEEMEAIEGEVDGLGVSSLVLELGGLAAYPSFVTNNASLRFTLDTVTEEWIHQYMLFKPLGFLYLLDLTGVGRNYEIATINESLAGMVSREVGSMVYDKYYDSKASLPNSPAEPEFDFNREMREIRSAVDRYLAEGKIEQAETFMEEKRQFLATKGYYIRKLNQAYFAFHGTYADRPTSISPIGSELRELRERSVSLKEFLKTVAVVTSHDDLKELLNSRGLKQ